MGAINMPGTFETVATSINLIFGLAALAMFVFGIHFLRNRKAILAECEKIKTPDDDACVVDPKYNTARALYVSMMLSASGWGNSHDAKAADNNTSADFADGGDGGGGD
jgi:hypothetical protein